MVKAKFKTKQREYKRLNAQEVHPCRLQIDFPVVVRPFILSISILNPPIPPRFRPSAGKQPAILIAT